MRGVVHPAESLLLISRGRTGALRFTGNASLANCTVARQGRILLDGSATPFPRPKVFGVCGMAVGDLLPQAPLYETRVEGAVGAYNSLVIADLDPSAAGNELYAAGSLGLRKWVQ